MGHYEIAVIQGDNDNAGTAGRRRKQGALASVDLRGGIFCRAARLIWRRSKVEGSIATTTHSMGTKQPK